MFISVREGDHLGNTLHQKTSMDEDWHLTRSNFNSKTLEIREQLYFAFLKQFMQIVQVLSTVAHGSMVRDIGSDQAEKYSGILVSNLCFSLLALIRPRTSR